jgi:RNA polymerase sigma-70 factor (ECF subfamily)
VGATAAISNLDGYNLGMQIAGQSAARADVRASIAEVMPAERLAAVMLRVRDRDSTAFGLLYDATVAKVFAMARNMLRNKADAEDMVCEVYEQAWLQAERFDPERGNALAWLLTICRSRCLDALRQRQVRHKYAARQQPDSADTSDDNPRDLLEQLQNGSAIHAALARLAPVRQQMVALAFFRDLSHQEIAKTLKMPLGTVKSHLRRAVLDLRAALAVEVGSHG